MKEILGRIVAAELEERRKQGYDVEALRPLLGKASGSCDALLALSQRIKEAPHTAGLAVRGAGRPGKRDGGV